MDLNKLRVRRSFIFTPGLQPEMFPKALASGADMVCIELEDGIAMKDKDEARKNTIDASIVFFLASSLSFMAIPSSNSIQTISAPEAKAFGNISG